MIEILILYEMKRTSERIVKFHSLAQFVSNFSDNRVCLWQSMIMRGSLCCK
ncbi:hypothetical protein GPK74_07680 [Coprococcus catus]|nr:hypothetical protein [Coprococcus catus]